MIILSAENKDKIVLIVPQELHVDSSLLEGDIEGEIRSEMTDFEEASNYLKALHQMGARIFHTDNDLPVIVHSSESRSHVDELFTFPKRV